MSKTASRGRTYFSGWRWQSRHHSICRELVGQVSGIWSMRPWQVEQPMPLATWMLWLKKTKSVSPEAFAHRLERGRVRPDLRVAVHAGLGGRDTGEGALFNRGVAVAAVNPHAADVVLVAEGDGLGERDVRLGDVVGAVHRLQPPGCPAQQEHKSEDARLRDSVRAAMEDLRHSLSPTPAALAGPEPRARVLEKRSRQETTHRARAGARYQKVRRAARCPPRNNASSRCSGAL